jgi:predicted AAA+ superfamily ATPase
MYKRLISLPKNKSFFLFGQRGTGKSTLLKNHFGDEALELSLLDSRLNFQLSKAPWELRELVMARKPHQKVVVIDEIQKVPQLLDEVHRLIEDEKIVFALTGSSARKLKRVGVNLLAGRAQRFNLYPMTSGELGADFNLLEALQWGTLPQVVVEPLHENKDEYLYAYVSTYLKEEIILEQVLRQTDPFSRFLEVAAQSHGENISFSNIAKDVGISSVSVKNYFDILVDTLIGFFLPSHHFSVRKKQKKSPKFYFHDTGLVRALQNRSSLAPIPETLEFGKLFEGFVINEIVRMNEYQRRRFEFSHLRIDEKDEIDLIIEGPGQRIILVEIKSKDSQINEHDVDTLNRLGSGFKNPILLCLSRDSQRRKIGNVLCLPWQDGLEEIFQKS